MNVEPRYTKHQVARGTRPDEERNGVLYLIKACSELRLTYQIRLLAESALRRESKVIIRVRKECRIHPPLRDFVKEHAKIVRIEKV